MKAPTLTTASAALLLGGTATLFAQSLPSFESKGFPITLHQAQIMGLADLQEQLPDPTIARDGMQASPHQSGVLKAWTLNERLIAKLDSSTNTNGSNTPSRR